MLNMKFLVISDDPVLKRFMESGLSASGHRTKNISSNDWEMPDLLELERPDFVIIDIMMPRMEGIETCLRLRQWSDLPIMMLSSWGAGKDRVRGLDLSADSYLTAPFGVEELMARLDQVLCQNESSQHLLSHIGSRRI